MSDPETPSITTRGEFITAIGWAFEQAAARAARRIVCVDAGFAEWPLDEPALHAMLTGWLRLPQRRLVLLANDYDEMPRRHPRFVAWRALWAHAIEAWTPQPGAETELPTLLVDDTGLSLHLIDPLHWRGRVELDVRGGRLWRERIDAVLQRSEPAFAVNRLGL